MSQSLKPKLSAVILAGGKSSRMDHQDKGLIKLKDKALTEYIADKLKPYTDSIYISTNLQENYQGFGYETFNDKPFPSEGPLCAMAAALHNIESEWILFVPCDSPEWPDDVPKLLLEKANQEKANCSCISHECEIQPLFSLINTRLKSSIRNAVETGERKVHKWLRAENVRLVKDPREASYFNINTPEDLKHYKMLKQIS